MDNSKHKTIHLSYYATLKEERGVAEESVTTAAATVQDLYAELKKEHNFRLSVDSLKVSINDEFTSWQASLASGDRVVFISPVSGG